MELEHVMWGIGIVVTVTSGIILFTCGLALKWIHMMREDFLRLNEDFNKFVQLYYERHEETVKREECISRHAILENKVDALHARLDKTTLGREP